MRIFAISDIHTDFIKNLDWIQSLSQLEYQNDILIVAGDVSDNLETIEKTFTILKSEFCYVFFVPGNHDLWVRNNKNGNEINSLDRLKELNFLCKKLNIYTEATFINDLFWIVPLYSWYEDEFDTDLNNPYLEQLQGWGDFSFCKWPGNIKRSSDIVNYFLKLNEPIIDKIQLQIAESPKTVPVITFSHFLPRRELLPSRDILTYKPLARVCGTVKLDSQIRACHSSIHVFGHTHINLIKEIEGVVYVQTALCYPVERAKYWKDYQLKCIWETNEKK